MFRNGIPSIRQETLSRHWVQPNLDGEDRLIWSMHNQCSQIWDIRSIVQQTVDHQMMATEHGRDLRMIKKHIVGFE